MHVAQAYRWTVLTACLLWAGAPAARAFGLPFSPYSPVNRERPFRTATYFIILHTTEGPAEGSLRKLRANGEAHYMVERSGRIDKIIDHRRVAYHAGRSMWDGRENLDRYSVGIEVVGYHDGGITAAQAAALKTLLARLQKTYGITDSRVLTHSMVAYGEPNRWFPRPHRGRKRCGMLFADPAVRAQLGLYDQPRSDPDVRAGRLAVGDAELARALYGRAYPPAGAAAAAARHRPAPAARAPGLTPAPAAPAGAAAAAAAAAAPGVAKRIGPDGRTAWDLAGAAYAAHTTVYVFPDGRVRRGDELDSGTLKALPRGTAVLVGYAQYAQVKAGQSAFELCGARWRQASTLYRFPDGSLRRGDTVNEKAIPSGTLVFWQG